MSRAFASGLFLPADDPELQRAWAVFPDRVMAHQGARVEYLGTSFAGSWQHCFRHRCHPRVHRPMYWYVPAARGWVPSMAEY